MAAKPKLPVAKPEDFEGHTLMRMSVENVKKVRLIDLSFNQPLTVIGGDFSQGKSTYLSGYEWVFGGKAVIDLDPIQHGKQSGTIVCEIGDGEKVTLRATCLLERVGESGWTRSIDLEIPGHMTPTKVQDFLDALAGKRSFDPMSFDVMKPDEQYETLRALVADFDFAGNQHSYDDVFKLRTDVNRDHKREQAAADAITVAETAPHEWVDTAALTKHLQEANKANLEIQHRATRRQGVADDVIGLKESAAEIRGRIEAALASIREAAKQDIAELESQIADLQKRLQARRDRIESDVTERDIQMNAAADAEDAKAADLQIKLDSAGPLPAENNTDAIAAKITEATRTNQVYHDWKALVERKASHQAEANRLAETAATHTKTLDDLEAARKKAIEEAKLPVEGIGFGAGFVTLNKVPWKQAGESERVDASTAIAMALHPRLKVILIRNGSGVAKRMRERIQQRAADKGYRVLMEVVDTPEGTHIVIEDGAVKAAQEQAA